MSLNPYWLKPTPENLPERYTQENESQVARSQFLVALLTELAGPSASVLEVGCNAGRNLEFLRRAGFTDLTAIEVNPEAVDHMAEVYPETHEAAKIHIGGAGDVLPEFPDRGFDVVFTMAVLEHLPDETAFPDIARIASRFLVTIEDEVTSGPRHYRRRYDKVFKRLGMKQIIHRRRVPGLSASFRCRVFVPKK